RRPSISPLFPYTTLFRSQVGHLAARRQRRADCDRGTGIDVEDPGEDVREAGVWHLQAAVAHWTDRRALLQSSPEKFCVPEEARSPAHHGLAGLVGRPRETGRWREVVV